MKRIIGFAIVLILAATLTLSSFAASTVSTAMYSDERAAGFNKSVSEIADDLRTIGVTDIKPTYYAAGSITVLLEAGLMAPSRTGEFKPEEPVKATTTVSVFAKVLGLAAKTDTPEQAVKKAQDADLAGNDVSGEMSRMEVARMLAKALDISPKPGKSVFRDIGSLSANDQALLNALHEVGLFVGTSPTTFSPDTMLTNAQLAILVDRLLGDR